MKKLLVLIAVFGWVSVTAQVPVARLATASSRFRQVRSSAMLQKPEIRMGTFEFAAPDQIKWVYDGMENVQLPEQMLSMIRQAVGGNMAEMESLFETNWSDLDLTLVPRKKQMKRLFSSIRIAFSSRGVARQVVLIEPSGDTTTIEFINLNYTLQQ